MLTQKSEKTRFIIPQAALVEELRFSCLLILAYVQIFMMMSDRVGKVKHHFNIMLHDDKNVKNDVIIVSHFCWYSAHFFSFSCEIFLHKLK